MKVSVEQMKIAILGAVNQGVYANDNYWWKQLKRLAEEIEREALCPTPPALDAGESAVSISSSHASAESTSQTLLKRTQRK